MSAAYNFASELPQEVRLRAESSGADGIDWMNSLQGKIEYLALKWGFRPGLVLTGGSESLILNVELDDGSVAVLKIGLPMYCDCANEARVLRIADGTGYVKLIDYDEQSNAL